MNRRIKELKADCTKEFEDIWATLTDIRKKSELDRKKYKDENKELTNIVKEHSKIIHALINYLDINMKTKYRDDMSYGLPLPTPQVKYYEAVKNE